MRPISVNFEIPYYTASGLQVRYLKIVEKSGYQALPWVRYITRNGDYQLRMKWCVCYKQVTFSLGSSRILPLPDSVSRPSC